MIHKFREEAWIRERRELWYVMASNVYRKLCKVKTITRSDRVGDYVLSLDKDIHFSVQTFPSYGFWRLWPQSVYKRRKYCGYRNYHTIVLSFRGVMSKRPFLWRDAKAGLKRKYIEEDEE